MCDTDKPYQAQAAAPANQSGASMYAADGIVVNAVFSGELPEKIEINGVTYRREADWVDEQVNLIRCYQAITECTAGKFVRTPYRSFEYKAYCRHPLLSRLAQMEGIAQ